MIPPPPGSTVLPGPSPFRWRALGCYGCFVAELRRRGRSLGFNRDLIIAARQAVHGTGGRFPALWRALARFGSPVTLVRRLAPSLCFKPDPLIPPRQPFHGTG